MQQFIKTIVLITFLLTAFDANAQPTDENGGSVEASAREQLFGAWDWVAKTRQPNRGGTERYALKPQGEQIRINFDRSGRCSISKNGATINAAQAQYFMNSHP